MPLGASLRMHDIDRKKHGEVLLLPGKERIVMIEVLPEGFLKRPPTMDDLAAVHALSLAYDMAEYGEEDITLGDLRNMWSDPSCNLQEDACMVFDPTGRLVGYMDMEQHDYIRCFTHIRILPGYEESEMVGNYLLGVAENWVRQRIY